MNDDDYDNDVEFTYHPWNLIQSSARSVKNNTTKTKTMKTTTKDNIHVYQPQDYIDSLSGVTKIAVIAISELVNQGKADFLFLRDEEVKNFWDKYLECENELRKTALAKLTQEEKKALGLK